MNTTTTITAPADIFDGVISVLEAAEAVRRTADALAAVDTTPAPAVPTVTCDECGRDLPVTKFPTRSTKNGVVRGTTCRECRDAAKGTRPCGPWCQEAKADKCSCACNGENHGIAHAAH